jgi:hypothetical protein
MKLSCQQRRSAHSVAVSVPARSPVSRGEQGQALIEFLVAALVLIPLFMLVPLVGKYLDIKQATIAASRKLAFECTVRYQDCANLNGNPSFADEIRTQVFSGDTSPVLSNDRPARDALGAGDGKPLWVDSQGRPLLENYHDVGIRADAGNVDVGGSLLGQLVSFGPGAFGLDPTQGLFNARVQVQLSPTKGGTSFSDQLQSLVLKMQFHTAILTNAWNANGPGSKANKCNTNSNTVVGRVSKVALCMGLYPVYDAAYAPDTQLILPLVSPMEPNEAKFNFHNFIDETFVDEVPTSHPPVPTPPDPVGFPRLP